MRQMLNAGKEEKLGYSCCAFRPSAQRRLLPPGFSSLSELFEPLQKNNCP